MSFHEKSSWIVLIGMVGIFIWYGSNLVTSGGFGEGTVVVMGIAIAGFIALVIAGQILVAVLHAISTGKGVDDTSDERDRKIGLQSERAGGLVLGVTVLGVIAFSLMAEQYFLASLLFLAMVLSEIVKNAWQVILYRVTA